MALRARTYTNKDGHRDGKTNNMIQVSGPVKDMAAVVKGDEEAVAQFREAVTAALRDGKAAKSS